jgi:hypothetical protein
MENVPKQRGQLQRESDSYFSGKRTLASQRGQTVIMPRLLTLFSQYAAFSVPSINPLAS